MQWVYFHVLRISTFSDSRGAGWKLWELSGDFVVFRAHFLCFNEDRCVFLSSPRWLYGNSGVGTLRARSRGYTELTPGVAGTEKREELDAANCTLWGGNMSSGGSGNFLLVPIPEYPLLDCVPNKTVKIVVLGASNVGKTGMESD